MRSIVISLFLSPFICFAADPAATKILDKTYKTYQSYQTLQLQFTLTNKQAESKPVVQKGSFASKSKSFRIILPEHEIYCNGITQWSFLKKNKEIQITNIESELPFYHPQQLAKLYKSGKYDYRLEGKGKVENKDVHIIDLKPLDREDPVFKIKLYISLQSQILKAETFNKNGERNTVELIQIQTNKAIPDAQFVIADQILKNNHVEDLRD